MARDTLPRSCPARGRQHMARIRSKRYIAAAIGLLRLRQPAELRNLGPFSCSHFVAARGRLWCVGDGVLIRDDCVVLHRCVYIGALFRSHGVVPPPVHACGVGFGSEMFRHARLYSVYCSSVWERSTRPRLTFRRHGISPWRDARLVFHS